MSKAALGPSGNVWRVTSGSISIVYPKSEPTSYSPPSEKEFTGFEFSPDFTKFYVSCADTVYVYTVGSVSIISFILKGLKQICWHPVINSMIVGLTDEGITLVDSSNGVVRAFVQVSADCFSVGGTGLWSRYSIIVKSGSKVSMVYPVIPSGHTVTQEEKNAMMVSEQMEPFFVKKSKDEYSIIGKFGLAVKSSVVELAQLANVDSIVWNSDKLYVRTGDALNIYRTYETQPFTDKLESLDMELICEATFKNFDSIQYTDKLFIFCSDYIYLVDDDGIHPVYDQSERKISMALAAPLVFFDDAANLYECNCEARRLLTTQISTEDEFNDAVRRLKREADKNTQVFNEMTQECTDLFTMQMKINFIVEEMNEKVRAIKEFQENESEKMRAGVSELEKRVAAAKKEREELLVIEAAKTADATEVLKNREWIRETKESIAKEYNSLIYKLSG